MTHTLEMLDTTPGTRSLDHRLLARCIEACFDCAQTCTSCADACLEEDMVAELRQCIRLDLDCSDLCETTGTVLSRLGATPASFVRQLVETCAEACRACGAECEEHADRHEHCRVCADACRTCEAACRELARAM